jgi:sodium-coupled neutral amino acid transporter 9
LKNIGFLLKLAEIGVVAIFTYGFFVIYIFLKNITSSEFGVYEKDIVWFSWDIVTPAG